jgi:hypothetical protein
MSFSKKEDLDEILISNLNNELVKNIILELEKSSFRTILIFLTIH